MIDWFVLLTPLLLLPVVVLPVFVGCALELGGLRPPPGVNLLVRFHPQTFDRTRRSRFLVHWALEQLDVAIRIVTSEEADRIEGERVEFHSNVPDLPPGTYSVTCRVYDDPEGGDEDPGPLIGPGVCSLAWDGAERSSVCANFDAGEGDREFRPSCGPC
jgi:hypothetical protein